MKEQEYSLHKTEQQRIFIIKLLVNLDYLFRSSYMSV